MASPKKLSFSSPWDKVLPKVAGKYETMFVKIKSEVPFPSFKSLILSAKKMTAVEPKVSPKMAEICHPEDGS